MEERQLRIGQAQVDMEMALNGAEAVPPGSAPPGIDAQPQPQQANISTPRRGSQGAWQAFPSCGPPQQTVASQQMGESANFMNLPSTTTPTAQVLYHEVPRTEAPTPPPIGMMNMAGAASAMMQGRNMSELGVAKSIHKESHLSIPDKANDCHKFDGHISNFEAWKADMLNNMAR